MNTIRPERRLIAHLESDRLQGSLHLPQDSVRLGKVQPNDFIGACAGIRNGIDTKLRRVSGRPYVGDISVIEADPDSVDEIDSSDAAESGTRVKVVTELSVNLIELGGRIRIRLAPHEG